MTLLMVMVRENVNIGRQKMYKEMVKKLVKTVKKLHTCEKKLDII